MVRANAALTLGVVAMDGSHPNWGVDPSRAVRCFKRVLETEGAPKHTLKKARQNLAVMYRDGLGCEQDAERAKELFQLAADACVTSARAELGAAEETDASVS